MNESRGPEAFHQPSLRRFVKRCSGAVIIACEPIPFAYATAAAASAGLGRNIVIVETRPEREADWKGTPDAINPDLADILCSVEPANKMEC